MMNPLACVAVVVLIVQAGAPTALAPQELRALDAGWAKAYVSHDTAFALRLFHEHLVVTSGTGQLKTRDGELADIRATPGLEVHDFRTTEVRIDVYGSTGIVTGLAEWSFTSSGRTNTMRRRYTASYARGGPLGWQMVALHLGPAPAK